MVHQIFNHKMRTKKYTILTNIYTPPLPSSRYHHTTIVIIIISEEKWEMPTADQVQVEQYRSYADLARGAQRPSRVGLLHASTLGRLGVSAMGDIDDSYQISHQTSSSSSPPELVEYDSTPTPQPSSLYEKTFLRDGDVLVFGNQQHGGDENDLIHLSPTTHCQASMQASMLDVDHDDEIDFMDLSPPPLISPEDVAHDHDADTINHGNHNNDDDDDLQTQLNYPLVKIALAIHRTQVIHPSSMRNIILYENHSLINPLRKRSPCIYQRAYIAIHTPPIIPSLPFRIPSSIFLPSIVCIGACHCFSASLSQLVAQHGVD